MNGRPILDCSMAMSWCFEDEKSILSEETFEAIRITGAAVPSWFFLEVANSVVVAERRRRLQPKRSAEFLDMLAGLDLVTLEESLPDRLPDILELARKYQLSCYDALHLDLAKELGASLASLDGSLCAAAFREGVAVLTASGK